MCHLKSRKKTWNSTVLIIIIIIIIIIIPIISTNISTHTSLLDCCVVFTYLSTQSQFEEKRILGCCTLFSWVFEGPLCPKKFLYTVVCFSCFPKNYLQPMWQETKDKNEKMIVNKKRQNFYACFFHLLVWSVGNINKKTLFCSMGFQRVKKTKSQVEWLFFKSKNKSYDYCTLFILRRDLIHIQ